MQEFFTLTVLVLFTGCILLGWDFLRRRWVSGKKAAKQSK